MNLTVTRNQSSTAVHLNDDKDIYEDVGLPLWAGDWEIQWDHLIVEDTILGKGNFGEVRLGGIKKKRQVLKAAIKILKGQELFSLSLYKQNKESIHVKLHKLIL